MNPVHSLSNVILEIKKKREKTTDIAEQMAYDDCLCLLEPHFELSAIDRMERLDELSEATEAIKKLAIREGMEAI